jgi:hypothetical protein
MGSFAVFHLLPTSSLVGLREVWPNTNKYLDKHAKELHDDLDFGGFVFYQLLEYLKDKKSVDLGGSDYHLVFPGADREGIWFLDKTLKLKYVDRLEPSLLSDKERKTLARELFGKHSSMSEKALLEALNVLKKCLKRASDRALVILHIIV